MDLSFNKVNKLYIWETPLVISSELPLTREHFFQLLSWIPFGTSTSVNLVFVSEGKGPRIYAKTLERVPKRTQHDPALKS